MEKVFYAMSKFKRKEPVGMLAKRKSAITAPHIVSEAQQKNASRFISSVTDAEELEFRRSLMSGVKNGKPWAMQMFRSMYYGDNKIEVSQQVWDIGEILKQARKAEPVIQSTHEDDSMGQTVDGEVWEDPSP